MELLVALMLRAALLVRVTVISMALLMVLVLLRAAMLVSIVVLALVALNRPIRVFRRPAHPLSHGGGALADLRHSAEMVRPAFQSHGAGLA